MAAPAPSSAWLNLGSLGTLATASRPGRHRRHRRPPVTVDNADTWLDFTDLVFIDPPGTGYSRILAKGDETRRHFYSVNGDIDALAVTIRKWLIANKRLASPKFIVGESYGGFRAPKLARRLQDEEGIGIEGLMLISPVARFRLVRRRQQSADLRNTAALAGRRREGHCRTDGRAAACRRRSLCGGSLSRSISCAANAIPQALARIAEKVATFTGLDPALVRKLGGRIDMSTFARERERAGAKITSIYDARVSGFDPSPHAAASDYSDPILDAVKTPLASAMADLTGNRLGWPVEAPL